MLALTFPEQKSIMSHLFVKDTFDTFQVPEASFATYCTFSIDGGFHSEFYAGEDDCPQRRFALWQDLRPICFSVIKGRRTPLRFKLVYTLPEERLGAFLQQADLSYTTNDVAGLGLNFLYDGKALTGSTGTSMTLFTLDKSLEEAWDAWIQDFLRSNAVSFENV